MAIWYAERDCSVRESRSSLWFSSFSIVVLHQHLCLATYPVQCGAIRHLPSSLIRTALSKYKKPGGVVPKQGSLWGAFTSSWTPASGQARTEVAGSARETWKRLLVSPILPSHKGRAGQEVGVLNSYAYFLIPREAKTSHSTLPEDLMKN